MPKMLSEGLSLLKGMTDASLRLGGGLTSFALMCRVGVSTLSKYRSPDEDNHEYFMPIDIAVDADRRAGAPIIVGEMARQLGYQLVPIDGARPAARKITEGDALDLLAEVMDVVRAIREAIAGGRKPDAADRKAIEREVREAQRELEEILINNLPEG